LLADLNCAVGAVVMTVLVVWALDTAAKRGGSVDCFPMSSPSSQGDSLSASVVTLLALTLFQRAAGFLRQLVFCRWLSPEDLGQWDLLIGFLELAAPVAVLGIPGCYGRYVEHYRQRGELRKFLLWTGGTTAALASLASAAVFFAAPFFSQCIFGTAEHVELTRGLALTLGVLVSYHYVNVLLTSLRRSRLAARMELIHSLLFAGLGVALLTSRVAGAGAVLGSYAAACALATLLAGLTLAKVLPDESSPASFSATVMWRKLVPFAVWVWGTNWVANLFELADRLMLVHFSGLPAGEALALVGNYHTARVFPLLLVSISGMLATMLTPYLSRDWEAGERLQVSQRLKLALKVLSGGLVLGYAILLVIAPTLFTQVMGGKYASGLAILNVTVVYCTWLSLARVAQKYLWCCERVYWAVAAWAVGVAANVGLNVLLIGPYGLTGVAWATAGGNAVSLLLILVACRWQGMDIDRGMLAWLILPLALVLGGVASLGIAVTVMLGALGSPILLSAYDRSLLWRSIEPHYLAVCHFFRSRQIWTKVS
jgi:polysaccharide transporter, PST family